MKMASGDKWYEIFVMYVSKSLLFMHIQLPMGTQ